MKGHKITSDAKILQKKSSGSKGNKSNFIKMSMGTSSHVFKSTVLGNGAMSVVADGETSRLGKVFILGCSAEP